MLKLLNEKECNINNLTVVNDIIDISNNEKNNNVTNNNDKKFIRPKSTPASVIIDIIQLFETNFKTDKFK